jgi:hypothetical protein
VSHLSFFKLSDNMRMTAFFVIASSLALLTTTATCISFSRRIASE